MNSQIENLVYINGMTKIIENQDLKISQLEIDLQKCRKAQKRQLIINVLLVIFNLTMLMIGVLL